MATSYTLMNYLLDRLDELGADRIFGVPGDYTLVALDHVERHARLRWVGCANELGAGYAADGYARMRGIGVLCTTFGVGELSAINAIAGSYAEHVPVLHIVGAPSRATQAAGLRSHHSLGTGDFGVFARMTSEVVCDHATLGIDDPCAQIDRVLESILTHRQPGYLLIPSDVAELPASPASDRLDRARRITDPEQLRRFAAAAGKLVDAAADGALLADLLVQRMGAEPNLHALIDAADIPFSTLLWGRRVVNEHHSRYLGTYNGAASDAGVREAIEDSDVLILAGVRFTDLTSGFFTQHLDGTHVINVGPRGASVGAEHFGPIDIADALDALTKICAAHGSFRRTRETLPAATTTPQVQDDAPLSQQALWDTVCEALRPGDLVLAEQGTSFYGMGSHRLPEDVAFIGQPLWASIGYTLPAMLGAALAAPQRRPVLLIGDGSAQLTIAELGTLIRNNVNALVVLVNNDGYTVERAIHGADCRYNDIARWDWTALPGALAKDRPSFTARATTPAELRDALSTAARKTDRLSLIEVVVPRMDVPPLLVRLAEAAAAANRPRVPAAVTAATTAE